MTAENVVGLEKYQWYIIKTSTFWKDMKIYRNHCKDSGLFFERPKNVARLNEQKEPFKATRR